MIPLSVTIVTKDEQANIRDALESIKDAEEIIVVDSYSTDRTLEICKEYTDNVFQEDWTGYARQKQKAIDLAKGPWILVLDADERITPALKSEIIEVLKNETLTSQRDTKNNENNPPSPPFSKGGMGGLFSGGKYDGYFIPRKNFFLGKWIRHSGWWPDYTLRLFKKGSAYMEEREVHEKIILNGKAGYLKKPMEHYTYRTISAFINKMGNYSTLAAIEMNKKGERPGIASITLRPFFTFLKMYFLRLGFLDGVHGLILAFFYSNYTFLKYVKVWEKRNK